MGLAFKPDIDDLRESPALLVADTLLDDGEFKLHLVEPNLKESTKYNLVAYKNINADIVVYLVDHKQFKAFTTNAIELDFCGVKK